MSLELWIYELRLRAATTLHFEDFSGPAFRGGLGNALRKLTCATGMPYCEDCPLLEKCPFTHIYNPQRPACDEYFRGELQIPRPFVLDAPTVKGVKHGEEFTLRLSLIGRMNQYLPFFVLALKALGHSGLGKGRGKYELISASSVDPLARRFSSQVYSAHDNRLSLRDCTPISMHQVADFASDIKVNRLQVNFSSPTHLVSKEHAVRDAPEFPTLIRAVLRRYSTLAALYGDGRPALDYKGIIDGANNVKLVHADVLYFQQWGFSKRKQDVTPTKGIVGAVVYEGDISPFLALLTFGQWLHIGKQSTFGMGSYSIEIAASKPSVGVASVS